MGKKRTIFIGLSLIVIIFFVWLFLKNYSQNKVAPVIKDYSQNNQTIPVDNKKKVDNLINKFGFADPLERASERITKKTFGQYISPQSSPVQPERFQGYHTGTDFEIFPEEIDLDVAVRAVCSGKIILKKNASGYGGVAVEACELEGNPITVIYGHLKLSSITWENNSELKAGDAIGLLGQGYSSETDGERKHLHLGFHKGSSVSILGYASSKAQLSSWLDPCLYICGK